MRPIVIAAAAVLAVTLAGCAPATDREGLRARGDTLVSQLLTLPDVLDAVVLSEKPGENAVPVFVRLNYDAGEEGVTDAIVAVRETMAESGFEKFSLEVQIDDSQQLSEGANIQWSGLPQEAALREETAVWYDLIESTPLRGLSYLASYSGVGSDVIVRFTRAVQSDGTLATEDEVEAALVAAWVAAGRDAEALAVLT